MNKLAMMVMSIVLLAGCSGMRSSDTSGMSDTSGTSGTAGTADSGARSDPRDMTYRGGSK